MLFGCHVKTNEPTTGIILIKPSKKSVSIDSVCTTTMGTPAFIKPDSLQIIEPEKVIVGEIVAPAIIKDSTARIDPAEIFNGNVEIIQVDTIQQTIKAPVLDSNNQLKPKPL